MAPDKRLERPEDGWLSPAAGDATAPAAQTPELGPEPPPPSDATRRDPGRRGRERRWEGSPQEAATKETHSPTRFRGAGGTFHGDAGGRWGLGAGSAERGAPASGIADSPGPPSPEREGGREGGRGRQSETKASAARRTKQDFGKQTQTSKPRSKKGKGGDTLGTPTERRHNSTWVETVTKSEDNKPKQAPLGGESALEVRRTWISKQLKWPHTPEWQAGGRAGGRSGVAGLRGWGLGGAGVGGGAGGRGRGRGRGRGGGGAAEGRGGEEDRTESIGIHSINPVFHDKSQLNE